MKTLILLAGLFSLAGCLEEENCYNTDEVLYYKTDTTEFYTVTKPVYKQVCE